MRQARAALGAALAVLVVLGAAGCSDSDGDDGGGDREGGEGAATTVAPAGAAPTPSAGCDAGAAGQAEMAEATLTVRGAERRYLLTAPAHEDGADPLPVLVDFHGLAEGAEVHAGMTQLGPMGLEEGFVTVFPHGTGEPVRWDVGTDPATNDDLAYVAAVLDRVEAERCVDTSRVYATGLSNGAMMTSVVACAMADRFAAVAPVAGIALPEPCEPARPVPVLTIHGTADPILLFNGGVGSEVLDAAMTGGTATTTTVPADLEGAGYPETVRGWAALAGCGEEPTDERVSDEVIRRTYDCPEESPVEFLVVEGGGHSWPSSEFSRSIERIVGPTTFDIDANRELWDFVSRFRLPPA